MDYKPNQCNRVEIIPQPVQRLATVRSRLCTNRRSVTQKNAKENRGGGRN